MGEVVCIRHGAGALTCYQSAALYVAGLSSLITLCVVRTWSHTTRAQTPSQPGLFYFVIAGTAVVQLLLAVPAAAAAKPAVVLD